MGQILIRNLPDDVVESFKCKAELAGLSLEQTLRNLLIKNAPFTAEERLAMTERLHAMSPAGVPPLTKEEIREGLE